MFEYKFYILHEHMAFQVISCAGVPPRIVRLCCAGLKRRARSHVIAHCPAVPV